MLVVAIDVELGGHFAAEFGLGEHALDGLFDDLLGAALDEADEGLLAQTAGKAGIAAIGLALAFEAGEADFAGVDDDDVVAHVEEGRVLRDSLAARTLAASVARRPRVLPLASTTNHLRSI